MFGSTVNHHAGPDDGTIYRSYTNKFLTDQLIINNVPYQLFTNWYDNYGVKTCYPHDFIINIFAHNNNTINTEFYGTDINNLSEFDSINYDDLRPNTTITGYYSDSDSPKILNTDIDTEATNRLILEGYSRLNIVDNTQYAYPMPMTTGYISSYDREITSTDMTDNTKKILSDTYMLDGTVS